MKRIEKPRPGDEILPKVLELVDACNRRVEGPNVIDAPQGWYVKDPPFIPTPEPIPFELYDDFAPGDTDKLAWPLNGDYTRDTTASPPTLMVSDEVLGDVRAYGSHHTGWSLTRGAMGFYVPGSDGKNQVLSIQRLAKMIDITTPSGTGGFAAGYSTTFTVTSCTVLDDGQDPCSEGASITIHNWNQALCNSVAHVTCVANGDGTWRVIDADCPPSGGCT